LYKITKKEYIPELQSLKYLKNDLNNKNNKYEEENFEISLLSMEEIKKDPLEALFGDDEILLASKKLDENALDNIPLVNIPKQSQSQIPAVFMEERTQSKESEKSNSKNEILSDDQNITSLSRMRRNQTAGAISLVENQGIGDLLKGAAGAVLGTTFGKNSKKTDKPQPKSEYGIPSFFYEECVICQYITELTQRALYDHLAMGQGDEYPHQNDIREVNQQVVSMPNGRGIVRIITENTVIAFCDPRNVPEIFYPYCDKLWKYIRPLAHTIFFQYGSAAVCLEIGMCGMTSYVNDATAVHLPKKSKIYNSGRAKCGFMGGVHESKTSLVGAALCTAQKMLLS